MNSLTANTLKTRGVAAIEEALSREPETAISVRGTDKYVVMELSLYHYLRECELDAAIAQSRADMAAGRFITETAAEHSARVAALLREEEPQPRRKPRGGARE